MSVLHYWVVVPAAGRGERFGAPLPKQYSPLAGSTVIEHALAPFLAAAAVDSLRGLVVVLAAGDSRFTRLAVASPPLRSPLLHTTTGGATRAESVLAGLYALRALGALDTDWVLVHDAARPCLGQRELQALLAALRTPAGAANGALLALPVSDTVKRASLAPPLPQVMATVPREDLWRALTPQAFTLAGLQQALEQSLRAAAQPGAVAPTDEAAAIEATGGRPVLVCGSAYNVKVTVPEDLTFAATVLRSRLENTFP